MEVIKMFTVLKNLFMKVVSVLLVLILQLAGTLSLSINTPGLSPAAPDGTSALQPAEQSAARAKALANSYYRQYFEPVSRRLSFYPNGITRTATCWEYIGLLSLSYKLALGDSDYLPKLDDVMEGLRNYRRKHADGSFAGYAVNWKARKDAPATEDIAYDDNMWLGRDFVGLYELTGEEKYLSLAIEVADWLIAEAYVDVPSDIFAQKGWPVKDEPVGSFYWSYGKDALHTCSTGPAAQFLAALYRVSGVQVYLDYAKSTYNFLSYLENNDGVFHDLMRFYKDAQNNITGIKEHDPAVYAYNSGSPITAAMELYRVTAEDGYLQDAKHWATAADAFFARPSAVDGVRQYPSGDAKVWFNLILLNGYVALAPYAAEADDYIEHLRGSVNYAYDNYRSKGFIGLNENILPTDWVGGFPKDGQYSPIALDVSAAAEIYATLYAYYLAK